MSFIRTFEYEIIKILINLICNIISTFLQLIFYIVDKILYYSLSNTFVELKNFICIYIIFTCNQLIYHWKLELSFEPKMLNHPLVSYNSEFQIFIILSALPDANILPSGLYVTEVTE